jgi:hypothetical protein
MVCKIQVFDVADKEFEYRIAGSVLHRPVEPLSRLCEVNAHTTPIRRSAESTRSEMLTNAGVITFSKGAFFCTNFVLL